MDKYRLYRFERGAKFSSAGEILDVSSDDEALALVRRRKLSGPWEIWKGNGFVARFEAPPTN